MPVGGVKQTQGDLRKKEGDRSRQGGGTHNRQFYCANA
ncbi:hypothetical protein AK972_3552 [Pseudomonas yamanorum]|nr:hypothetical protein AK972_3552 [Pseudomonas yamanorum]